MYVFRQAVGQRADKAGNAPIGQQMEVVNKHIAAFRPGQRVAQVVRQQAGPGGVGGAGVVPQQRKPCVGKGVLCAFPEDGQIVRIDADADDPQRLRLGPLAQVPVDGGGLSVAHGGHHGGQRAAGDGAQALLQPLRYIDGIQIPLPSGHGAFPPPGPIAAYLPGKPDKRRPIHILYANGRKIARYISAEPYSEGPAPFMRLPGKEAEPKTGSFFDRLDN